MVRLQRFTNNVPNKQELLLLIAATLCSLPMMEPSEENLLSLLFVRSHLQQNQKFKQNQGLLEKNQGLSKSYAVMTTSRNKHGPETQCNPC